MTVTTARMAPSKRRLANNNCSRRARALKKSNALLIDTLCKSFIDRALNRVDGDCEALILHAINVITRVQKALKERVDDVETIGIDDLPELHGDEVGINWPGL